MRDDRLNGQVGLIRWPDDVEPLAQPEAQSTIDGVLRCSGEKETSAAALVENRVSTSRTVLAPRTSSLSMRTIDFVKIPSDGAKPS